MHHVLILIKYVIIILCRYVSVSRESIVVVEIGMLLASCF